MPILNKTKKMVLANEFKICKSEFSKMKGLMFSKKFTNSLIFPFKSESYQHIHMFFVFYPIDILWLDNNKKVVQLVEKLKPFRVVLAKKPAIYIIELENGIIRKSKTEVGDTISF